VKILIAGLGSIGRRHLRNLVELGERDLLLLRTGKSTLPEKELSGFPVVTSLQEGLEHDPDAVIISNPTALHLDVALPAARAGCHLLIEKPVSDSIDGISDLVRAVERSGSRVLVGYQLRFHPGLQAVKRWLEEGRIGAPYYVSAFWGEHLPDWHPWEPFKESYAARRDLGGGVVLTLSHPLDYLRWMFGPIELRWAAVDARSSWNLGVEDSADIFMICGSQTAGHLHLDYLRQPPMHGLEISGSEGTIHWDGLSGAANVYRAEEREWRPAELPGGFERNTMFVDEMLHFIDIVKNDDSPRCTLDDGIEALKLALAIRGYPPAEASQPD
jgi:predicted dehydrogenase